MLVLVLQHADAEHPAHFGKLLLEDGHRLVTIRLNHGERLPSLDGVDALWVMGGPMDVWQEATHPWLRDEKAFIREAVVERGLPYLGICLGHQLLAEALGGRCGRGTPEVGVMPVFLTEEGARSVFFDGLEDSFSVLQWHGAEIKTLPEGAKVLASSPHCAVQAMSWGARALSLQFHVEVEETTVRDWAAIPEYGRALERALGEGAVDRLAEMCAAALPAMNVTAERLYINWLPAQERD